jgi:purine-cytosine permease-like protein
MFFTHLARICAILIFIFGFGQLTMGLVLAFGPAVADMSRYISSPGHSIDRGVYALILAVALVTLAEISFNVRRGRE